MYIGNQLFETEKHTYLMGILNVTPDSFSDGGRYDTLDQALYRAGQMIAEGADIIDLGGESTRPGYQLISDEAEMERVIPILEQIRKEYDIPLSVDTYKSKVAKAAIQAGADLINDIWGFTYDPRMAEVVKNGGCACCLMHNRKKTDYTDFIQDVKADLKKMVRIAKQAGIAEDKIILDPGLGFAKTYEQNLKLTNELETLHELSYPLLLGASRKSMIGLALDLPSDQRMEGTLVTTVFAVLKKCAFVRVHDIKENKRAIQMTEALVAGRNGEYYG